MRFEVSSPIDVCPERRLRLLLCDGTGAVSGPWPEAEEWVSSPIRCLDSAVDCLPGIIAVRFGEMPAPQREALLELITALKRNSHTRERPLLALLHSKHRRLIEDLARSKVDFIRCVGDIVLDSTHLGEIIEKLGPEDRPGRHLEMVCSFLHYIQYEPQQEMTVCGAYLDRLVLGGQRLQEWCETEAHLHCEHYLNPRCKS